MTINELGKTSPEIEAALLRYYDCELVILNIDFQDEVHAYGTIPNTNQEGWFFVGFYEDVERHYKEGRYN